jgi:hypothetical protein
MAKLKPFIHLKKVQHQPQTWLVSRDSITTVCNLAESFVLARNSVQPDLVFNVRGHPVSIDLDWAV